jgi:hypothetical protein
MHIFLVVLLYTKARIMVRGCSSSIATTISQEEGEEKNDPVCVTCHHKAGRFIVV